VASFSFLQMKGSGLESSLPNCPREIF
jgi:hypothetical protein